MPVIIAMPAIAGFGLLMNLVLFAEKDFVREQWRAIERAGEAEEWLRGVGAGANPAQEWEDHMWKVYHRSV